MRVQAIAARQARGDGAGFGPGGAQQDHHRDGEAGAEAEAGVGETLVRLVHRLCGGGLRRAQSRIARRVGGFRRQDGRRDRAVQVGQVGVRGLEQREGGESQQQHGHQRKSKQSQTNRPNAHSIPGPEAWRRNREHALYRPGGARLEL